MTAEIPDWDGIANGTRYSIREKTAYRLDAIVPEEIERKVRPVFDAQIIQAWRAGFIDMETHGNDVHWSMTEEQAELWKQVRSEDQ